MSINGMGEFGFNIKKYQQMQGAKFGSALRGGGISNMNLQFNDSIFKTSRGAGNPFRSRQTRMEKMGGYNADAIAMLNKMQAEQKAQQGANGTENAEGSKKTGWKSLFSKETIKAGSDAVKAYNEVFGKGSKKTEGAGGKSSEAVNDIKNAQDKETLNNAIENASNEQKGVQAQEQKVNQQAKTSENKSTQAKQNAQQTEQKLNQSTNQLKQNEQSLEQAKADVQTCTDNYTSAQGKTASCKQALENAKAAATSENPNSAAIAQAQSDLKQAEMEEQKAKEQLDAAKQKETEAQKAVDQSKEQVQADTKANTEAQQAAQAAETETQSIKSEQQTVQQENKTLQTGIAEGEQKVQQMETETPEGTDATSAEENTPESIAEQREFLVSEQIKISEQYANGEMGDSALEDDPYYQHLKEQEADTTKTNTDTTKTETKKDEVKTEAKVDTEKAQQTEGPKETPKAETKEKPAETPKAASKENKSLYETQRDMINNGDYSADEKQQMNDAMDQVMNLQPGETKEINGYEYKVDEDGTIHQYNNGLEVGEYQGGQEGKEMAAMNAGSAAKHKIDTNREFDAEIKLMEQSSKTKGTQQTDSKKDEVKTDAKVDTEKTQQTVKAESKPVEETKKEEAKAPVSQPEDDTAKARGFSENSTTTIYANEDDDSGKTFEVREGKYFVDGQEVDEKEFNSQFDEAKSNSTEGEPEISETFSKKEMEDIKKAAGERNEKLEEDPKIKKMRKTAKAF